MNNSYLLLWFSTSFLLASFTKLSKYSKSLGIMSIISIGFKEIFPLMKCDNIIDLIEALVPIFTSLCLFSTNPSS